MSQLSVSLIHNEWESYYTIQVNILPQGTVFHLDELSKSRDFYFLTCSNCIFEHFYLSKAKLSREDPKYKYIYNQYCLPDIVFSDEKKLSLKRIFDEEYTDDLKVICQVLLNRWEFRKKFKDHKVIFEVKEN